MIFICNIMDYKCHIEWIIMLLFTIMKEGQSTTHLCLLKSVAFFVLGQVKQEVKYGPVVIRWAQCNRQSSTYSPVIYSLIKKLENNKIGTN